MHCRSGSIVTESIFLLNKIRTQSIILIIKWGGLASFFTVAMSAVLMVCEIEKIHITFQLLIYKQVQVQKIQPVFQS